MIAYILSVLFPPRLPGRVETWESPAPPFDEQGSASPARRKKYKDGIARYCAENPLTRY
jgi:hypothetical protein